MSNLNNEEQLLLQEIFLICVDEKIPKIKQGVIFLPQLAIDIQKLNQNDFSLLQNETMFDNLLFERFAIHHTNVLEYLNNSYSRALHEQNQQWNESNQQQNFIKYSKEIIGNFGYLLLSTPEVFEAQEIPSHILQEQNCQIFLSLNYFLKEFKRIALQLIDGFNNFGLNFEYFNILKQKFKENSCDSQIFQQMLKICINCQNAVKFLSHIICFFNQRLTFQTQEPFQILNYLQNLSMIRIQQRKQSLFLISKLKMLQEQILNLKHSWAFFQELVDYLAMQMDNNKLSTKLFLKEFQKILKRQNTRRTLQIDKLNDKKKYYSTQFSQYNKYLIEIFKELLTKNNYQEHILQFISSSIKSSQFRAKEGFLIQQNIYQLQKCCSHAFFINLFDVMLDISKVFVDKSNQKYKDMVSKINPFYYKNHQRLKDLLQDPFIRNESISAKVENQITSKESKFGTITEYFFMTIELFHIGYSPILQEFIENSKKINQLKYFLNTQSKDSPLYKQFDNSIKKLQDINMVNFVILSDDIRIKLISNLFDVLIDLLLEWVNIDTNCLKDGIYQSNYESLDVLFYLPEHIINCIFQHHQFNLYYKQDYTANLSQDKIQNIIRLLIVLLSNIKIISNPYCKAKILDLVFLFVTGNKARLKEIFKSDQLAQENLIPQLINFYYDIEFTGQNNAFYLKYHYRFFVTKLLMILLTIENYKQQFIKIQFDNKFIIFCFIFYQQNRMEQFINMLLNDTTYCFNEGIDSLTKFIELYNKKKEGKLDQQEVQSLENQENSIRNYFRQVTSSMELFAYISELIPNAFMTEVFRNRIAAILDSFLLNLLKLRNDQTKQLIIKDQQLNFQNEFKQQQIFSNTLKIFAIFRKDEKFCQFLANNSICFNDKLLDEAIHIASNENVLPYQYLIEFQSMLIELQSLEKKLNWVDKLNDIPQKYLDPLMYTLMMDPVYLPTSNIYIDRATIKQQLLDRQQDPFNRKPLKMNDIQECPEFKKEIHEWVRKQLYGDKKEKNNEEEQKINELDINQLSPDVYDSKSQNKMFLDLE